MVQQSLSDRIETTILSNLFFNEDFTRKALPFIESDYFTNSEESILFSEIEKFVENYKNLPTKDTILIELSSRKDLTDSTPTQRPHLISCFHNDTTQPLHIIPTRPVENITH